MSDQTTVVSDPRGLSTGQINYEAFVKAYVDFDVRQGIPSGTFPTWAELDNRTQEAWRTAAIAVARRLLVTNNA